MWEWWFFSHSDLEEKIQIQSQTSSNGHLSRTAIFLADSPYIHSCFNLSTMAGHFLLSPRWLLWRVSSVLAPNRGQTYDLPGLLLLGQMLYHQVTTDSWDLRPLSIVGSFHILVLALCGMFVTQTQLSGLCFLVSLGDSCRASSPGCSKVG